MGRTELNLRGTPVFPKVIAEKTPHPPTWAERPPLSGCLKHVVSFCFGTRIGAVTTEKMFAQFSPFISSYSLRVEMGDIDSRDSFNQNEKVGPKPKRETKGECHSDRKV